MDRVFDSTLVKKIRFIGLVLVGVALLTWKVRPAILRWRSEELNPWDAVSLLCASVAIFFLGLCLLRFWGTRRILSLAAWHYVLDFTALGLRRRSRAPRKAHIWYGRNAQEWAAVAGLSSVITWPPDSTVRGALLLLGWLLYAIILWKAASNHVSVWWTLRTGSNSCSSTAKSV